MPIYKQPHVYATKRQTSRNTWIIEADAPTITATTGKID